MVVEPVIEGRPDDLPDAFRLGIREAMDQQAQPPGIPERGTSLQTPTGIRFYPDWDDYAGPLGMLIAGGLFALGGAGCLIGYSVTEPRELVLAVIGGVAAFLGVSLLAGGRRKFSAVRNAPRVSGVYLFPDALVRTDKYARVWLLPRACITKIVKHNIDHSRSQTHIHYRIQDEDAVLGVRPCSVAPPEALETWRAGG